MRTHYSRNITEDDARTRQPAGEPDARWAQELVDPDEGRLLLEELEYAELGGEG